MDEGQGLYIVHKDLCTFATDQSIESKLSKSSLPYNVFRAGTGAVIINTSGEVLGLERFHVKDAWQLPQGGIEENEEPLDAVYREVHEETGLERKDLQLLGEYPDWLAYELPAEMRSGKHGRGQVQKWFLFRLTSPERNIRLDAFPDPEFSAWRWMSFEELIDVTISFRRSVYQHLADYFSEYLAN